MKVVQNLFLGLSLLLLPTVSLAVSGDLLWEKHFDREGNLEDWARAVTVSSKRVFVVGPTQTTAGGFAFSVRAYNPKNGILLWENHFDREGTLLDRANAVAVDSKRVFVAGRTQTTTGNHAFSVRAYAR